MRVFRFIFLKDIRLTAIIASSVTVFSFILLTAALSGAKTNEPYYGEALASVSSSDNILQAVELKMQASQTHSDEAMSAVQEYLYGEGYDPSQPPRVIPNELVEALYEGGTEQGEFAPDKLTDEEIWSDMFARLSPQFTYRDKINEQLESYERNARRGMTDKYVLKTAELLGKDYSKVLALSSPEKPIDTRTADAFADWLVTDKLPFICVFVLLFFSFAADRQSRRFEMIALTRFGAYRYTRTKLFSSIICVMCFQAVYGFVSIGTAAVLCGSDVLSAPMQVLSGYELAPESLSVFGFFMTAFLLRSLAALTVALAVLLVSFLCRRVILAAAFGAVVTALPMLASGLIDRTADLESVKAGVILSADVQSLFVPVNYISIFGAPTKLLLVFLAAWTIAALLLVCVLLAAAFGGERNV